MHCMHGKYVYISFASIKGYEQAVQNLNMQYPVFRVCTVCQKEIALRPVWVAHQNIHSKNAHMYTHTH